MSEVKCKWCGGKPIVRDSYGAICAKCWLKGKEQPKGGTNKC